MGTGLPVSVRATSSIEDSFVLGQKYHNTTFIGFYTTPQHSNTTGKVDGKAALHQV
jgi:hypothetical protein